MESKQVLLIEQMQHLQELGLDTSNASASWYKPDMATEYIEMFGYLEENELVGNEESIPAYTLQDVLDMLPIQIEIPLHPECGKFELRIKRMVFNTGKVMHAVVYEKSDYIDWFVLQSHEELIDAAYEMLCWVIEQGYVETNKNE